MVQKPWRVIPRPLLETVLNNHAQHHRVPQALVLHGPRGSGKTTLLLERLLEKWNKGPHVTGYVDFAQSVKDHHPLHHKSFPWGSWSNCPSPPLPFLKSQLEQCLESMAEKAVKLGAITSHQIFSTLDKWHGLSTALCRVIHSHGRSPAVSNKASASVLWDRAVFAFSAKFNSIDLDDLLGLGKGISKEEAMYLKEAFVALKLAKEVIRMQQGWRANAVAHLNSTGCFSRSLANSATDWPCLLLELLSSAAEIDHFQPKLVLNNIDVLRNAQLTDNSTVCASMYHDSLLWRIIALGANERCLPVILVTSDSYYSYRAYMDFGFPDIIISRETFGWTPAEAKLHMVPDYFSASELTVVSEVLGPNPRHLFELYSLKQSNYYQKMMGERSSTYDDIVDAYLAYLQNAYLSGHGCEDYAERGGVAYMSHSFPTGKGSNGCCSVPHFKSSTFMSSRKGRDGFFLHKVGLIEIGATRLYGSSISSKDLINVSGWCTYTFCWSTRYFPEDRH